jgi:hypothetical protein
MSDRDKLEFAKIIASCNNPESSLSKESLKKSIDKNNDNVNKWIISMESKDVERFLPIDKLSHDLK